MFQGTDRVETDSDFLIKERLQTQSVLADRRTSEHNDTHAEESSLLQGLVQFSSLDIHSVVVGNYEGTIIMAQSSESDHG